MKLIKIEGKFPGKLSLGDIEIDEILTREVVRNNKTSSKIYLSKKFENKIVYVIIPKERGKR